MASYWRCADDAQRAHEFVGLQSVGAQNFAQLSMHDAAVKFKLPTALLRVGVAHGKGCINLALGKNVRHICCVAGNAHALLQTRQFLLTRERGKALLDMHRQASDK
jgi:hypothetical protein